jgi:hypothetical protein
MRTVQKNEIRSTGPTWNQWPADLPQVAYVMADGALLCVTCANGGNGSLASLAPDTSDQWRIIGAQVSDGDPMYVCAHCDRAIPKGR